MSEPKVDGCDGEAGNSDTRYVDGFWCYIGCFLNEPVELRPLGGRIHQPAQ